MTPHIPCGGVSTVATGSRGAGASTAAMGSHRTEHLRQLIGETPIHPGVKCVDSLNVDPPQPPGLLPEMPGGSSGGGIRDDGSWIHALS
jgi:hypothetical protein